MPNVGFYQGQAPTAGETTALIVGDDGLTTAAINIYNCTPTGLLVPDNLISSSLIFQTSLDNIDWYTVKNSIDGADYIITLDGTGDYDIDATKFAGRPWVRLICSNEEEVGTTFILVPWLV